MKVKKINFSHDKKRRTWHDLLRQICLQTKIAMNNYAASDLGNFHSIFNKIATLMRIIF